MVAAARLNKAQERIVAARPFAKKLELLLHELAYLANNDPNYSIDHPFMKSRTSKRIDVVLITADRGLCGGFNAHLIRHTLQFLKEHQDRDVRLWIVGKKGRDFFRRFNSKIEKEYVNIFQNLGYKQAEIIGKDVIDAFINKETEKVVFIYNEFKSRIQQELTSKVLLPIQELEGIAPQKDFIYEPNKQEILDELMPRHIKGQIYRMLLESQSAELAARMTAMENATNNAGEVIDSLTLTMNKIRQAAITKEISEIVGGAEALQAS